jgi:branched-chain amino acid transport system permease protein
MQESSELPRTPSAVLSAVRHVDFVTCVIGALAIGILLTALLGLVVSHVRDVYFLMITLALGMVLWGISYRWIPVTGGDNGISGIPRLEVHAGLPVAGPVTFYYIALAVFAVCGVLLALIVASPFGLALQGTRENEGRMKSLGFNTWLLCYASLCDLRSIRQRAPACCGRTTTVSSALRIWI